MCVCVCSEREWRHLTVAQEHIFKQFTAFTAKNSFSSLKSQKNRKKNLFQRHRTFQWETQLPTKNQCCNSFHESYQRFFDAIQVRNAPFLRCPVKLSLTSIDLTNYVRWDFWEKNFLMTRSISEELISVEFGSSYHTMFYKNELTDCL